MIREALEFLTDQATEAKAPHPIAATLRNATMVVIKGMPTRIEHQPQARKHKVASLESLATLLNGSKADNEEAGNATRDRASVWHFGNEVVAILDDGDASFRDDRATWALNGSKKFAVLTGSAATPRDHKPFVEFLVENLRDELESSHPGLLGAVRKLRFTMNAEANSNVQHGKSIENEVTGAAPLPETVILNVKRWADLKHVIAVECLFQVDPESGKLALKPLADELQEAENKAQAWLHEQLTEAVECPVYYGSP